jgi:tripartite-type tricarboxylate transporter receptor subunit TctC
VLDNPFCIFHVRRSLLAATLLAASCAVVAQPYPSRPVAIIVPYSAGGETDVIARIMAARLTEDWKRTVLVDNRAGGGTVIGTAEAANAKPDGHTLLLASFGFVTNRILIANLPYDSASLTPLTLVATAPNLLYVHPSLPTANLKAFIALAKSRPGQMLFASPGYASSPHISAELLASMAGYTFTHVPYKGTAPVLSDLLGGQVHALMGVMSLMPNVRSGKLRALAVASERRMSQAPDVPTMVEAGGPNFTSASWFGFFVQTKTPPEIAQKIYTDLRTVALTPEFRKKIFDMGLDPTALSKEEFAAFLKAESDKWGAIIRARNIKLE